MKKLLLLSALLIFACSSDDSSNNDKINVFMFKSTKISFHIYDMIQLILQPGSKGSG